MPRVLRAGDGRVTQIELFFDLVYVFAVTQLAHLLVTHTTVDGAVRTAVLLAMVWQVWVYTTWMTNYLDPDTQPVRLGLIALMLASLVLAAAIPEAFGSRGWLVASMYVAMQVGRSLIVAVGLHGHRLEFVFWRAGAWCLLGAVPMLIGAAVHGHAREALWALAVAIEIGGAAIGFPTPGIGRSATSEWTIDGRHFAERCQAFVLIALGESLVVSGGRLTELLHAHLDTSRRRRLRRGVRRCRRAVVGLLRPQRSRQRRGDRAVRRSRAPRPKCVPLGAPDHRGRDHRERRSRRGRAGTSHRSWRHVDGVARARRRGAVPGGPRDLQSESCGGWCRGHA